MVTIITGNKGTGKTKRLIALVNEAAAQSAGNVVCVEKTQKLTYEVSSRARLIAAKDYGIEGYDAFYGFLSGICAGDHDITDIFVDATLKIGGRNLQALAQFLSKIASLSEAAQKNFVFTVSEDPAALPKETFELCKAL
jgi:predicted ATPase